MKFGRTFRLEIQVAPLSETGNTVVVEYPLTVEFEVSRNTLASANTGRFVIYNLKEETRRKIFHDRYDTLNYRGVNFQAGYLDQRPLPLAFRGNVIEAYSQRRGKDWVTVIEAFDGGFGIINSQVSQTLPARTSISAAIRSVLGTMTNVAVGAIEDFGGGGSRGQSLMGNSWDVVNRLAGRDGTAFVDNEVVNVLGTNSYLSRANGIQLITSDTGLLNTPRRHDARIDLDILFEPRAVVGQSVEVRSLESVNNGVYKIIGVSHRGTISGAVDGGAVTTLSLWAGTVALTGVQ